MDLSAVTDTFKQNFQADVAKSLNVSQDRIQIKEVKSGGIFISFLLLPAASPSAPDTPQVLYDQLITQFASQTSPLRSSPTFASVDTSVQPVQSTLTKCQDGSFQVTCPIPTPTSTGGGSDSSSSDPVYKSTKFIVGIAVGCGCLIIVIVSVLCVRHQGRHKRGVENFTGVELQYDDIHARTSVASEFPSPMSHQTVGLNEMQENPVLTHVRVSQEQIRASSPSNAHSPRNGLEF